MLSRVCELPWPSSFVQTIEGVVEQAADLATWFGGFFEPLGQVGESARRYHLLILVSFS